MAAAPKKTDSTNSAVEYSPDERYMRFEKKLGHGAYKDVFLAYDTETGKEVAWNTVNLKRMQSALERKRVTMETEILKNLHHPHIINFYDVWKNEEKEQICFTTEIVTSGTLKEFMSRVKRVKLKVMKKWCRQILTALDYLHSHDPPIIHRDLKCDNIFINGSSGEIRIGDFGLSAARRQEHAQSVLGTPQFMAPELYDEMYTEGVDIYAFGMCVLEMCTKEYPYEECANPVQIWRKVTAGIKPLAIQKILDPQVRNFIEICLVPQDQRLSARELLRHPFLAYKSADPREHSVISLDDSKVVTTPPPQPPVETGGDVEPPTPRKKEQPQPVPPVEPAPVQPPVHPPPTEGGTSVVPAVMTHCDALEESVDGVSVKLALNIHFERRRKKQIRFQFTWATDTPEQVAAEMAQALQLPEPEHSAMLISRELQTTLERIRVQYFQPQPEGDANGGHGNGGTGQSPSLTPQPTPDAPPHYTEIDPHPALPPLPEGFVYAPQGSIYMASPEHGGYVPVAIDPQTAAITILPGHVILFEQAHGPQAPAAPDGSASTGGDVTGATNGYAHGHPGHGHVNGGGEPTPAGIVAGPPTPALVYPGAAVGGIDPVSGLPIADQGVTAVPHDKLAQLEKFLGGGAIDANGHPIQPIHHHGAGTIPPTVGVPPQPGQRVAPGAVTERPKGGATTTTDDQWAIDPRSRPATPGGGHITVGTNGMIMASDASNGVHMAPMGNGHTSPTDLEQRRQNEERIQNLERELAVLRAGQASANGGVAMNGHNGHGPASPITVSTSSTSLSSMSTVSPNATPSGTPSHAVGVTSPNGITPGVTRGGLLAFSPDGGITPRQLQAMGKTSPHVIPVDYPHGLCNQSQPIGDPRLIIAPHGIKVNWSCCGSTLFAPQSHIVPGQGCGPDVRDVAIVLNGEHKSSFSPVTPSPANSVIGADGSMMNGHGAPVSPSPNGHITPSGSHSHMNGHHHVNGTNGSTTPVAHNGSGISEIEAGVAGLHRRGGSMEPLTNGHQPATLSHSTSLVTMAVDEGDEDDEDDAKALAANGGRPSTLTARDLRAIEAKKKFEEQKAAAARKKQVEKEAKELQAKQAAAKFDNLFGSGQFRI